MAVISNWWGEDVVPRIRWAVRLSGKRIKEGEMLPTGYGVAWMDYERHQAIGMPVPINVIAGGLRALWFWLKAPPWYRFSAQLQYAARRAYLRGREDGYKRAAYGLSDSVPY